MTDGSNRSKTIQDNETWVYALHLECAADKTQETRMKLSKWYGSTSKHYPNDTKMRLVPPFNTILSQGNKQKYTSLIARQSVLNSRMGTSSTWEMLTNLLIDRPEPKTGIFLRQLLMSIPSQTFPGTPLCCFLHFSPREWLQSKNYCGWSYPFSERHCLFLVPVNV
jgi:hypothetical protein